MSNELKVYNEFGEVILNVRASGSGASLLTVDATDEMQTAINEINGRDLDITIHKGAEELKFTAKWGSPEFLQVLARYLVDNFGWKTKVIETLPSPTSTVSASGSFVSYPGPSNNISTPMISPRVFGSLIVDDPKQRPRLSLVLPNTATGLTVDRH
jgi:hypothetical protein